MGVMSSVVPQRSQLLQLLAGRDGAVCAWCSRALDLTVPAPDPTAASTTTVDHVRPTSQKGSRHPNNLVLSCKGCNQTRGDRPFDEWAAVLEATGATLNRRAVDAALARLRHGAPYMTKRAYGRALREAAQAESRRRRAAAQAADTQQVASLNAR